MNSKINENSQEKKTIFIIEDHQASLDNLCDLLALLGPVKGFTSAQSFLNFYTGEEKGLLICDIRLPGMGGILLYKTLLKQKKFLPTIFITGHGDISMAVECMKLGALDFITKPYKNIALKKIITL